MTTAKDGASDTAIEAWARLQRVAPALLAAVEAELKAADLPPLAWYDALLELRRAGAEGLRPYRLQEEMLLAQYSVSRLADRLVAAGYAARRPCPEDARGQVLIITAAGRDLLKRMWPVYRAAILEHFAGKLDAKEVRSLAAVLGKLA